MDALVHNFFRQARVFTIPAWLYTALRCSCIRPGDDNQTTGAQQCRRAIVVPGLQPRGPEAGPAGALHRDRRGGLGQRLGLASASGHSGLRDASRGWVHTCVCMTLCCSFARPSRRRLQHCPLGPTRTAWLCPSSPIQMPTLTLSPSCPSCLPSLSAPLVRRAWHPQPHPAPGRYSTPVRELHGGEPAGRDQQWPSCTGAPA